MDESSFYSWVEKKDQSISIKLGSFPYQQKVYYQFKTHTVHGQQCHVPQHKLILWQFPSNFSNVPKKKKRKNLPLNHKSNYWCELYETDYKDFLKINHLNIHSFSSLNAFRQCENLYI